MYIKCDARVSYEKVQDFHLDITEPGPTVPTEAEVKAQKIIAEFRAKRHAKQLEEMSERCQLSQRESEIFSFIWGDLSNKEIAEKLLISERSVRRHVHNIFAKLNSPSPSDHPPTPAAAALPIPRRRSGSVWAVSGEKPPRDLA